MIIALPRDEVYGHEYAMHSHGTHGPQDGTKTILFAAVVAKRSNGAYNGWERANWFAKPGDDTSKTTKHGTARPWGAFAKNTKQRDHCGVLDLPGFSRFWLQGDGADEWLRGFCTGGIPKIGRMNLVYIADNRGRILSEFSCIRIAEDNFVLITAATAQWHDGEMIRNSVPESVSIRETTTERDTLIVTGKNRATFRDHDVTFRKVLTINLRPSRAQGVFDPRFFRR